MYVRSTPAIVTHVYCAVMDPHMSRVLVIFGKLADRSTSIDYATLGSKEPYNPLGKWRATLNLVFAIGAVYGRLIGADWCAGQNDHRIYHSRAWLLSLDDPWWFSHPDLSQMQITSEYL
jgi:hypothetical protein